MKAEGLIHLQFGHMGKKTNQSRFKSVHGQDGKYIGYKKKQKKLDNSKLNLIEVFSHTRLTNTSTHAKTDFSLARN